MHNQEENISILSSEQVSLSLMKFINHFYKLIDIMINRKLEETNMAIEKMKNQIEKLKEAKQSLISEAVTGKIEIL